MPYWASIGRDANSIAHSEAHPLVRCLEQEIAITAEERLVILQSEVQELGKTVAQLEQRSVADRVWRNDRVDPNAGVMQSPGSFVSGTVRGAAANNRRNSF